MRSISATTRLAAIIGDPVRHSLSPVIHNAAFAAAGLDWVYVAFELPAGSVPRALDAVRTLGIDGLSVTMPHKAAAAEGCDELGASAAALGVVNTVVRAGDRLIGHNTDGGGFVDSLAEVGFEPAGRRCIVLGAGGAARAVVHALGAAGAVEVGVTNRTAGRAASVVALAGAVGRVVDPDAVGDYELVVNATSVGMAGAGAPDSTPCDVERLSSGQVVADLVYEPEITPLVGAARERGARAIGGLGMLLHQGARQFRLWTGEPPPMGAMTDAARAALAERRAVRG